MPAPRIPLPEPALAEFCRRHRVRRLALFGSVLRDDFGEDSDVDVLVEFEAGHTPQADPLVALRHMLDHAREAAALAGSRSREELGISP